MYRILVTYASKIGSTIDVAEVIAKMLEDHDIRVDLYEIENAPSDLDKYDAVVVGSPIRRGAWLPEAVNFVKQHKAALYRKPVAYFVTCLTLQNDTPENHNEVYHYIDPVLDMLHPIDVGLFAGKLDTEELPLATRLMMRLKRVKEGDFRDWDLIRHWALHLRQMIKSRLQDPVLA
ncbi:MAG: flavodoxin [Chloroflexi bacterium]|nr:MAG: flavodoxin [Chloroflexota bacterium]